MTNRYGTTTGEDDSKFEDGVMHVAKPDMPLDASVGRAISAWEGSHHLHNMRDHFGEFVSFRSFPKLGLF
ncbi:hypothetical protein TcBrA4_0055050 [Trypanosoma cruzi]|nr:hypothetical protein TcBrA4_0055050 [Trypanosoma cruzi]